MSATNTHSLREIADTTSRVSVPPTIEAYLRLVDVRHVNWQDRAHFPAICARAMRRIPVAYARSCGIVKPGAAQVSLEIEAGLAAELSTDANFLEVNDALKRQAEIGPGKSHVVELRFLEGLGLEETAEVPKVSSEILMRDWRLAKAWLYRESSVDKDG